MVLRLPQRAVGFGYSFTLRSHISSSKTTKQRSRFFSHLAPSLSACSSPILLRNISSNQPSADFAHATTQRLCNKYIWRAITQCARSAFLRTGCSNDGRNDFHFLLVRNWLLSLSMLCWTILCGWAEIAIGLHFPSDILAAYLYGIVIACIIYIIYFYLYLKISPRLNYISTQYTKTGYSLTDINVVICTLLFSVGAAILYGIFLTTHI